MSLPFDATLKDLVQSYPRDWLAALGLTGPEPVTTVNVDLSTVSAATDVVFALGEPPASYVTLDFQSGRDPGLSRRLLVYNALLHQRTRVPVHSVVVLLRRAADDTGLDGSLRYEAQAGRGGMDFRFEVVRLWEWPADELLRGPAGILPLAPLGELPAGLTLAEALPRVLRQLGDRLSQKVSPPVATKLLTAAFVLTGMRIPDDQVDQLYQELLMSQNVLDDSTTYQWILKQGALRQGRQTLLLLGRAKFGEPEASTTARVEAVDNLITVNRLTERVLLVSSWQELFESA